MNRIIILSIGRDTSAFTVGSPLYQRLTLYDTYHTFIHVIMAVGDAKQMSVGNSVVLTSGGKTLVGAFINALRLSLKQCQKNNNIRVVTTQDVLYAGLAGYIVSVFYKKSLYVQLHGDYLDNPAWFASNVGYGNRLMNGVGKWVLKRATAIRVVSERLRQQIIREQHIAPQLVTSIPIGTDLRIFSQSFAQERTQQILFVGRLIPEKEPLLFCRVAVRICKQNPDVTIGIAGDGFMRTEIEDFFATEQISSKVTFYGALAQRELAHIYAKSYCYIHTAGWEGWGMPMIESIATGCPVVTTDSGCAGEAIRHLETGLVVPVSNEDALVAATNKLLTDHNLWSTLVENGRREAVVWSQDTLALRNMNWYGSIK